MQRNRSTGSHPQRISPAPSLAGPQANPAHLQQALTQPGAASAGAIIGLQRKAGNRAVSRLIQAKLTVGPAADRYEQEAERVASDVMSAGSLQPGLQRTPPPDDALQAKPLSDGITPLAQGEAGPNLALQAQKAESGAGFEAGTQVEDRLRANQGHGNPLPGNVRAEMESRFGANFSDVRVHSGGEAASLSKSLQAQAFTHGSDIYFGSGKFTPHSTGGQRLLAHELTHVVQQTGGLQRRSVIQRLGDQWEGYKDDMSVIGGLLQKGFVSAPRAAYNYFAPSEEEQERPGIGQSIKRGGKRLLGGIAAGVTGAVTGAGALVGGALGATASTVGRGIAGLGKGIWSGMKSAWGGMRKGASWLANKWSPKGEDAEGRKGQKDTFRFGITHTATSILNGIASQAVSLAAGGASLAGQVTSAVTGPIASVLGLIKGAVSSARAHRARKRQNAAERAAEEAQQVETVNRQLEAWKQEHEGASEEESEAKRRELEDDNKLFLEGVLYLGGKNKLKKWRSIMEASTALAGAAGSAALTGGMLTAGVGLAALLASNPVGWGIALGLVGTGILAAVGYVLYRGVKALYKGKKKGVNRRKYAEAFYGLVAKDYPPAIAFLKEIGVLKQGDDEGKGKFTLAEFKEQRASAIAYLESKMRST